MALVRIAKNINAPIVGKCIKPMTLISVTVSVTIASTGGQKNSQRNSNSEHYMKTSETTTAIMPDFVKALAKIKAVKKDSQNPFLKNKYASLDAIIETVKPILEGNNLAAIQILNAEGVETYILHVSGEWLASGVLTIPVEVKQGLSQAQAVGVATTYAKRYQLGAILGISTDEDTDGQYQDNKDLKKPEQNFKAVTAKPEITPVLMEKIVARIKAGEDLYNKTLLTYAMTTEQIKEFETLIQAK
jgi:hypothetical protein